MEHPSDDIEVLYDQCVKLFNRNVELSNLIDEKNSLYSKYNGLNGDLLELIELGTKLVTETKILLVPCVNINITISMNS